MSIDVALDADADAFAAAVRAWLAANPPERFPIDGTDAGYGSGAHSRPFLQALAAQGWISMTWPRAFGGAARPFWTKLVLLEELAHPLPLLHKRIHAASVDSDRAAHLDVVARAIGLA